MRNSIWILTRTIVSLFVGLALGLLGASVVSAFFLGLALAIARCGAFILGLHQSPHWRDATFATCAVAVFASARKPLVQCFRNGLPIGPVMAERTYRKLTKLPLPGPIERGTMTFWRFVCRA